jgi:hypothetical protein
MRRRTDVIDTLRQRLISARHFGTLAPDGRLPSARTLASELQADPRVVVAAYGILEREGLVERRPPSRGFFVVPADRGDTPPLAGGAGRSATGPHVAARPVRRPHGDDWLVDVLVRALERDVRIPDFPEQARRAVETLRIRSACIECNADQTVWLCRELHDDYGIETDGVEIEVVERALVAPRRGGAPFAARLPPELRRADLLVTTPAHAEQVHALAVATEKTCVVVTLRTDLLREIERLLAREPVYFLGTDPRFATKLRQLFSSSPHLEHVRPVILGRDALDEIPDGSPAYVMRTARDRLGGVPPRLRVLSTLRAFSAETRRQLVRHIVRANRAAAAASAATRTQDV